MEIFKHLPTKRLKSVEYQLNSCLKTLLKVLNSEFEMQKLEYNQLNSVYSKTKSLTQEYYRLFDLYSDEVIRQQDSPICCGAECSNCCNHYPMTIEPFEMIYFYFSLRKKGLLMDYISSSFENHHLYSSIGTELLNNIDVDSLSNTELDEYEEKILGQYFSKKQQCAFVNSVGSCGVYSDRPVTCRMYLSLSEQQYCTHKYILTDKNKNFIIYLPDQTEELICQVSDCFSHLEIPNGLFSGLCELNAHEHEFGEV